jgi:predicted RNA polymerase sigma factor
VSDDLIARARAFAELHPEAKAIIDELAEQLLTDYRARVAASWPSGTPLETPHTWPFVSADDLS